MRHNRFVSRVRGFAALVASLALALLAAVAVADAPQATATAVPFSQAITQYAPAGLHMEPVDPLTVTVGGGPVSFAPTSSAGVYTGQVGSVTVTVTFTWYAAAQALRYVISLANSATTASPPVVITPLTLSLDADPAANTVPCAKAYGGSSANFAGSLNLFNTTSAPAVQRSGTHTGTDSSVLQVAMNAKSSASPTDCSEQQRSNLTGLYTGLSWSAGWQFSAGWGSSSNGTPPFVVTAGTDQATASSPLTVAAQQSIDYPTVNLGFVTGASTWNDIENAQVNFVRSVLQPTLPGQVTDSPVSYDSYFGVDGTPPLPFLQQQARRAAALGVKYFTIDAGWYHNDGSGDQFSGLGNSLTPSISQYPQGQASMADFCMNFVKALGMSCAIWLVPQANSSTRVDEVALDPNKATDFVSGQPGYGTVKLQLQLKSAQDWAVSFLDSVIRTYGVGWIRFETQAPNLFLAGTAPYTTLAYNNGLTSVMQRVRAQHPDVYLEGSQAGGQRMDLNTAEVANGDWTKDFSIDGTDSRLVQTHGLRIWPSSFLNLTDAGCTPPNTFARGALGCTQAGVYGASVFDNVGDQWKVLSRMAGKLSFDGYISQWPASNVAKVRAQVAAYAQVTALQDHPAIFPLAEATPVSWDAVAFGGAASAAGLQPTYPASPGQALYVFRGNTGETSKSFCLPNPARAAMSFTLLSGPVSGGASISDSGACPATAANYIPGGELFTVTLPMYAGALFLRDVTGAPAVAAPSAVLATQADRAVRVSWTNGSTSIAGSQVSRSADNGATWSVVGTVQGTGTSYVDAEIAPGATYLYGVSAYDTSIANRSAQAVSAPVVVQSAATVTTVYDTDPAIVYGGNTAVQLQQHVYGSMPYGTSHLLASGDSATYTCSACTRLVWNARPGAIATNATATVTLYNSAGTVVDTRTVDTANATVLSSRPVYDTGARTSDDYKLTITPVANNSVSIDSIGVTAQLPTLTDDAAGAAGVAPGDSLTFSNVTAYTNLPTSRGYVGNTAHSGNLANSSFTYTCGDCTSIAWLSHTGPDFGTAAITLDGVSQGTVNAGVGTGPSASASVLYTTNSLPQGAHTLTIANTGTRWLEADAFQVVRPQPADIGYATHAADDTGWTTSGFTRYTPTTAPQINAANYYREQSWSTQSRTSDGSVKASYVCTGCDRLQLITGTGPELGIANVTVTDGTGAVVASGTVDLYSPVRQPAHGVFDTGALATDAGRTYTLTVTPTGTKNANASAYWIEVQAVRTTARPVTSNYNQPPPRP